MTDVTLTMQVNGLSRTITVPARTMLADLLRDYLRLTGTHLACEHGVCGACTVLVDGAPIRSCITLAASCDESQVVTIEGLDTPQAAMVKDAFKSEHALQCGFCTPGMLIAAVDLIQFARRLAKPKSERKCRGTCVAARAMLAS
jgi:carbon-monoxide dehydrogenase small subunit